MILGLSNRRTTHYDKEYREETDLRTKRYVYFPTYDTFRHSLPKRYIVGNGNMGSILEKYM